MEIRLKTARAVQPRLTELLSKAVKVAESIAIDGEQRIRVGSERTATLVQRGLQALGVKMGLGTDANVKPSLIEEMRAASFLQKVARLDASALDARTAELIALRKAAVEHIKRNIRWTALLGGEVMAGPFHSPLGVFSGSPPNDDEKKRAADVLREAAEEARQANVMLAIEYLNRFECYFLTTGVEARALVHDAGVPGVAAAGARYGIDRVLDIVEVVPDYGVVDAYDDPDLRGR